MMEFAGPVARVDIQPDEYNRLLGYPREWTLEGRAQELADWARDWYQTYGRPSVYARSAGSLDVQGDSVSIEGTSFTSGRLARVFRDGEAHGAILAAVSAGPELEAEAQKLWWDEKPDEYFFLETYGSAVVERLTAMVGARLSDWAQERELAVLPHYSPGYPDWDIAEQPRLLDLMSSSLAGSIEVLDSGALRPKKSLLAVYGVTRRTDRVRPLNGVVPCQTCSLASCDFRRVPGAAEAIRYTVNRKALQRWAAERLSIERLEDHSIHAHFRYDGTTCTNLGRPLTFHYDVTLEPREDGYLIREERCSPAPGDDGHESMCQYLKDPVTLMAAIEREKPLLGQPLNDVLSWEHPDRSTGCYCDAASREHKWGLVLETIHYALHS
ncbi:MAG TPA: hypothetical protein VKU01_09640 [Bryobacteraceae bacterium]|nr:hypothetical protein [Bryobacteraceae bacterium]